MTNQDMHNPERRRVPVLQTVALIMALGLVGVFLRSPLIVNGWSIAYDHLAMNGRMGLGVVHEPPAAHSRAPIWLGREALARQDSLRAIEFLSTIKTPNKDSLRLEGRVNMALGDFQYAIDAWTAGGDYLDIEGAAQDAANSGDFKNALDAFEAACKVDREECITPLASFLGADMGDRSRAIGILQAALQDFSHSNLRTQWWAALGGLLVADGQLNAAHDAYSQLLSETPNDVRGYLGLGWLKYERGDGPAAASAEFRMAITSNPRSPLPYVAMGQILVEEARYREADPWFEMAIQLNPSVRSWYLARGNAARASGNIPFALTIYHQTAEKFPEYAAAYYEMADALDLNGETRLAVSAIKRAISLTQEPPVSYYLRAARLYETVGDTPAALQALHKVLLADPQNRAAQQTIRVLEISQGGGSKSR